MPKITKKCDFCKKEFTQYERKNYKPKCCSIKCANEMKKIIPSPKKNKKYGTTKGKDKPREYSRKQNIFKEMDDYYIGFDLNKNEFYFDKDDLEKVNKYCWRVKNDGYVHAYTRYSKEKRKFILLHRLIMNFPKEIIDHLDRNPRNNRKNNLELSNFHKNSINKGLIKTNTSGYTGVYKRKNGTWYASIKINYNSIYLGSFKTKPEAIKSRQQAEFKFYGKIIKRD